MSAELRPLGVNCNILCHYCYQNPQRDAGNFTRAYDLEAMKAALLRERGGFTLFGGEPLLLPEKDLEELWSWGLAQFGQNSLQTNGTLIQESHLRMFKQYRVHVGISLDGPGELNHARWASSMEKTDELSRKAHEAIKLLCAEGMPPSLIVTLHRGNASAEKLPAMHAWFRRLDGMGLKSARLHLLEVDHELVRRKYALSDQENTDALLSFARLESGLKQLRFDVFADMQNLLAGRDRNVTCVWRNCDPYTTEAVRGIEGTGQSSNCGRTNKDGVDFTKAETRGYERYVALYYTPQEHGGCRGCRFFLMCKGQCPGTAIDGDWRNRTEHCEVWKSVFSHFERVLMDHGKTPLSLLPERQAVEEACIRSWSSGQDVSLEAAIQIAGSPAHEGKHATA